MRFLIYLGFIIGLIACNNALPHSFKLEGSIEGAENSENIVLCYFSLINDEWREIADTAKIIDGKFFFEGNIEELTAAELCFDGFNVAISARIYIEPTTMKLQINKNQPYAYKLSGTKVEKENIELKKDLEPDEKIYCEGLEHLDTILKQINLNVQDNDIPVLDSLLNVLQYVKENTQLIGIDINKKYLDFILRHNTYRIVPDLLYLLAKSESIPVDTVKYIYNNLPERSKTGLMGKLVFKQIGYLGSEKDATEDSQIGNAAPDFTGKDFSGKTISLSDFRNNNYVLLDFWASWCAPCITGIPKIKDLYNKYNEKGFTIVSISLDSDRNNWLNAIHKYQLEAWPQILSGDDKNNDKDIFFRYGVQGIPHFTLVNKQGKIIANEPGSESLLNKIDSILSDSFSNEQ
jgi:thiol-disulfide isomerase/thioredoxin